MTDGYALLRAIEAAPDDKAPRLVYADWLEENGDEAEVARAEFIRLQCAARGGAKPGEREAELLATFEKAWLRQLPRQVFWPKFHRGFIDPVHTGAFNLCPKWEKFAAVAPLHHVHLYKARLGPDRIAACPVLDFVRRLDLSSNVLRNDHLAALMKSPHLGNLAALDLSSNHIGVAGCEALAAADLPAIRKLALSTNPIRDRGLLALLEAGWFACLTHLSLTKCELTERGVVELAASPAIARLRRLRVDLGGASPATQEELRLRLRDGLNPRGRVEDLPW